LASSPLPARSNWKGLRVVAKERLEAFKRDDSGEHRFTTVRVDDPALIGELETAKVRFAGVIESKWFSTLLSWILPAMIFFALWGVIMKRMAAQLAAYLRSARVRPRSIWRSRRRDLCRCRRRG